MVHQDKYKWSIIYTDHQNKFIHLDHLTKSNPTAQILLANIENKLNPKFAWRNSDSLYRLWLKNNINKIKYNNIAILEWDVLVSKTLPNICVEGLIVKQINNPRINPKWYWFKQLNSLEKYSKYAMGITPLAVMFMNKQCIDILLDKEFDTLYDKDIFCELRLPTILNSKNIKIIKYPLPDVDWNDTVFTLKPSIYHPIKIKQD